MLEGRIADPGSTADWLRHAESDLRLAAAKQEGVLLEMLCFHAQQAAEKALKALLVHQGREVPRTHNIGQLLDLLESQYEIPADVVVAARLTLYAVETRYPTFGPPVRHLEYQEAVQIATATVRWVKQRLAEVFL